MNRFRISVVNILVSALAFSGCSSDNEAFNPIEQLNKEVAMIDEYLAKNNIVAQKHVSGIRMIIDSIGSGLPTSIYSNPEVEVEYEGHLFEGGAIFAPKAIADDLPVSEYIAGWQIALSLLPEGSKATVFIPSYFAYGTSATGAVPANSTLVFDLNFKKNVDRPTGTALFKTDTTAIRTYLTEENINATYDPKGIWYVITDSTEGIKPMWYDKVKVKYSFRNLADPDGEPLGGEIFEQEPDADFDSRVIDYFNGMQIGLQNMTEGSKARFYVPSGLAFAGQTIKNAAGQDVVAKNTNLIVDMELVDVIK